MNLHVSPPALLAGNWKANDCDMSGRPIRRYRRACALSFPPRPKRRTRSSLSRLLAPIESRLRHLFHSQAQEDACTTLWHACAWLKCEAHTFDRVAMERGHLSPIGQLGYGVCMPMENCSCSHICISLISTGMHQHVHEIVLFRISLTWTGQSQSRCSIAT